VQLAEKYTPDAVDVASGLNIAAFNVGIAMGALVGGVIVNDLQLLDTPWIGGVIVLGALVLTRWSGRLEQTADGQLC
jgi:MFS transporter, DHA1 family, inner membrane transport protein